MTLKGFVQNGVVVLENGCPLVEGTRVEVLVQDGPSKPTQDSRPTLAGLLEIAGTVKNLPSDFADQHDHYLHGTPKR
jgi:hypothetical protein